MLGVALVIAGLVAIGEVRTTWSFSAFSVLIYYALTNLAALRLSKDERIYPRWIAGLGFVGCAFLAFAVEPRIWLIGSAIILVGLAWHAVTSR